MNEVVDLRGCVHVHGDDSDPSLFQMDVVTRSLFFRADSAEERNFWIDIIQQAIRFSLFPCPSTDPSTDDRLDPENKDSDKGKEDMVEEMARIPKQKPMTIVIKEEGRMDKNLFLMSDDGDIAHVKKFLRRFGFNSGLVDKS